MNAEQTFVWVQAALAPLQLVITLAVIHLLPRPTAFAARATIAVILAWAVSVAYTALIHNPAGIAAGHELGMHFPESHFDNNTIASQLMAGWFWPTVIVAIYFLGRRSVRAQQGDPADAPSARG